MLTTADIEGRPLLPLSELLGSEPAALDAGGDTSAPDLLDRVSFADSSLQPVENGYQGQVVLVVDAEIALTMFGDDVALVVGSVGGLTVIEARASIEQTTGGLRFAISIVDVPVAVRVPASLLRPLIPGTSEPDQSATHLDIPLGAVTVTVATEQALDIAVTAAPAVPPCMIGDTGVIVSVGAIRWLTPSSDALPDDTPPGFTGLFLDDAVISLAALELDGDPVLTLDYAFLGRGGFTGRIAEDGLALAGSLGGFTFELDRFELTLAQNAVTASEIAGTLALPFFDAPLDVAIGLELGGGLTVSVSGAGGGALAVLEKPDICRLELDGVGLDVGGGTVAMRLSGALTPLLGAPELDWPTVPVKELSIDSNGQVRLDGGWLDLDRGYGLDFHGFQLEITKLGFGRTEDGGKWIGLSGALNLVEGLPAGVSAQGLRVTWYDDGRAPGLSFDGVGVEFEVPETLRFKGEVAYRELPGGVRRFDGAIELDLVALDTSIDGVLVVGTARGYTFFAIYLDVELPAGIPLFATGLGLYGFAGLFALNMEPDKRPDEQWYSIDQGNSWYHRGTPGVTDLNAKWTNRGGSVALGAGVTLGTVSDNGFAFSGKVLLAIVFPGPIVLVEGAANLLKERAKLGTEEPMFRALALLDARAGAFTFGLDATYRYGKGGELIDLRGSAETYFSLADPSAWHVYIGRKEPTEQRIRADIFQLFNANAYFELAGRGLATGAWIGIAESWRFGPASVSIEAWIEGQAALSFKPSHLSAGLWLHGKVEASAFGIGIGLSVDARLAAEVFTPFLIRGEFEVTIAIPILPDISVNVELQWGPRPADPPLPLPLKEIAVEHVKAMTSWPLPPDGDQPLLVPSYEDAANPGFLGVLDQAELDQLAAGQMAAAPPADLPVVPLDGRPHVTFGRAVNDRAVVGTTAQQRIDPEWERIGDPAAGQGPAAVRYTLLRVVLHRLAGAGWLQVGAAPTGGADRLWGSWAPVPALPDGDQPTPSQTKLWLWSANPFDYARRTGGTWDDAFDRRFPGYPCPPPLPERTMTADFEDLAPGSHSAAELQTHVFDQTFIGPTNRALVVDVQPPADVPVRAQQHPAGTSRMLARRGLADQITIAVKPSLADTDEPCRAVRIAVSGGKRARGEACVIFAGRPLGPISTFPLELYEELPFAFAARGAGAEPAPALVIVPAGELVVGLECGPRLDIATMHPFERLDLTLSCSTADELMIQCRNEDGSPAATVTLQGPYFLRAVELTGTRISEVELRAPRGAVTLERICGTAEYALHAMATGDRRYGPFPVQDGFIEVAGNDLDFIELHSVSPYGVAQLRATCGPKRAEVASREETIQHVTQELARWSQPDFALESYATYRLQVQTLVEVKDRPDAAATRQAFRMSQFAYFRTEGPPGLADLSLPRGAANPEELTLRDRDGALVGPRGAPAARPVLKTALNDLTPYLRETTPATVPAVGEKPRLPRPVYRAYDVAVAFNENAYVESMYRRHQRDLALYVFNGSNEPARDTTGAPAVGADDWTVADQLMLSRSDEHWVKTVNASGCVSIDRDTILRDAQLVSRAPERVLEPDALHEARLVPLLLHDDFGHGLDGWMVVDEGAEGGPSSWKSEVSGAPPAPYVRQRSSIRGGTADPLDPVKPGTFLLRADDARLAGDHPDQPAAWADLRLSVYARVHPDAAVGVVFGYQGPEETWRVSLSPMHWLLVRTAAGVPTVLAAGERTLAAATDHLIAVEAVGGSVRLHLDGMPLAVVADTRPVAGRVGLYCWNAPSARFADFRVDDFRDDVPVLYRFGFVTSRFANFFHQAESFQDEVWQLRLGGPNQHRMLDPLVTSAALPSADASTRSGPSDAETRAFEALVAALSEAAPGAPTGDAAVVRALDVTRVDAQVDARLGPLGWLVRGPEPIDWRRVTLAVLQAPAWPRPPGRPGDIKITDVAFGSATPNEESITLLLRDGSDLSDVVLERLAWSAGVDPAGAAPEGWIFVDEGDRDGPSAWEVATDGRVLQTGLISGPEPGELGTCALAGDRAWDDFRLTVTLSTGADGAIGVVFRYLDRDNGYRFSIKHPVATSGQAQRRLVRRADGQTHVLWEDTVAADPGQPHVLVLECEGETLIGMLDGAPLFAVRDATHEAGRFGLYSWANPAAHFADIAVATREWTLHHAFEREAVPLPAGTRVRLYSGNAGAAHDADTGVVRRFAATGGNPGELRISPGPATLRIGGPPGQGGHTRRFETDDAYAAIELRVLRNGDGTAFFLARPDGAPLPAAQHRLQWTYHRDNRAVDVAAPVLTQAGLTEPEHAVLDLPWRTPWVPGPRHWGLYPSAISACVDRATAELTGTEVLLLKGEPGPLRLHVDCAPWGFGGGLPETDVWVVSPSGDVVWHGERIDLALGDPAVPVQMREGRPFKRLEWTLETAATGVFRVLFGARGLPLYQGLTDDLPEALSVKPASAGAAYLWGDSRGTFLNASQALLSVTVASARTDAQPGGRIRLLDADRLYRDLSDDQAISEEVGFGVAVTREVELQAGPPAHGAVARLVASGPALFGSASDLSVLSSRVQPSEPATPFMNLLRNPDFGVARAVTPPPLTGTGGELAAAEDWTLWNNDAGAITATELDASSRPAGNGRMLRLTTTAAGCGLVQQFQATGTGPAACAAWAWVLVVRGRVGLGSGNGGNTHVDVVSTASGRWELLQARSGVSPVNEVILYATDSGGAEVYVEFVGVRAVESPTHPRRRTSS